MSHGQDPGRLDMPVGEAMFSQRSIRRFRPDPVPVKDLELIVAAAGKAPNGGNRQRARFLVVTDPDRIRAFGALYREAWWAKRRDDRGWTGPEDMNEEDRQRLGPAMRMADEMAQVPCMVLVLCLPPSHPESVLPAAQNLMLAARALGIGSVPTRVHPSILDRLRALFAIPDDVVVHLAIPLGYPQGRFGPTRRLPSWEVSFHDAWGAAVPWAPRT